MKFENSIHQLDGLKQLFWQKKNGSDPNNSQGLLEKVNQIERELLEFEQRERQKLGLDDLHVDQWAEPQLPKFTKEQRDKTTILVGGLTMAQDLLVQASMERLGYKVQALPVPDNESMHLGKEFGNRGQCNPTYYTVGNLLKYLIHLRDEEGLSPKEIVDKFVFLTAGACGPCRFGMYATEYRKALRDSGFENFRVLLFQQQGGLKQATGDGDGLEFSPKFFIGILQAIMLGDILNALGYRIRPYELEEGATDRALEECKSILADAFRSGSSLLLASYKCRKILNKIPVNRLQPKPKVMIIGEFWAMTTEGDGNYRMQRFLESEGAEVDIQLTTAWILYMIWQHIYDTDERAYLPGFDAGRKGIKEGLNPKKKIALLRLAEAALRGAFKLYSQAMGLTGYKLPDMFELARISQDYYPLELRGGEGHMEVGKVIQAFKKRKAHLVISVKPFGCMPSSAVSDGVQTLVTKHYPEAIFCPIETSGDGQVNAYSRVQMFLFKAKKRAEAEFENALREKNLTEEEALKLLSSRHKKALFYPPHKTACTGANLVYSLRK